jgi:predicted dehydrogenase
MVDCAKTAGRTLSVGLFWNFNPAVRHLIGLSQSGFPESLSLFRRTPPIWGRMRHIVFDLMMHDIDAALSVAGIPDAVRATGLKNSSSEHDRVAICLGYPGKTVSIEGSSALPMGYPFTSGFCAQGKDLALEYRVSFPKDGFEMSYRSWNAEGEVAPKVPGADPYEAELRYLIDCLSSGASPDLLSGDRALSAIRIAEEAIAQLG